MIIVIAIITMVLILFAGLIGAVLNQGDTNTHHMPSLVSRIIDWMN